MLKQNKIHALQMVGSIGQRVGGPPRSVSQLSSSLIDANVQISLVTACWADDPNVELDPQIKLIDAGGKQFSIGGTRMAGNFSTAIRSAFKSCPPDIIHIHGLWLKSCRDTVLYARREKIPYVISPRGMLEPWAMNHKAWKKKLVWRAFQGSDLERATAFHATAESEAESIRKLGFKQPIAVIPNGVDLPNLKIKNHKAEGCVRTALFLSRINPKKGLLMLLDAWKHLEPKNWRLVIAGNDDSNHLPVVEAKIAELGLKNNVELVGPLFGHAKEAAFHDADFFVLPSYSENFGIVVAEALSYQLPVLTTRGCPWSELETESCGWWCDATPNSLVEALAAAFETPLPTLYEMGARGRELVAKSYLWPAIGGQMADFYHWLYGKVSKPDFIVS